MQAIARFIQQLYAGGANKAVIVAAGSLLNAAESGNWTSTQSTVGYVMTILTWLVPNVVKAVGVASGPPKGPTT